MTAGFQKLLLTTLISGSALAGEPVLVDRIEGIVNNEVILKSDVESLPNLLQKGLVDESLLFGVPAETMLKDPKLRLNFLIDDRLVESAIDQMKLRVTADAVEDEARQIARANRLSLTELYKAIESQGLTKSEYQASLRSRIERNGFKQQILGRVRLTDEDVLSECYRRNPQLPRQAEERTLAHIFFNPKKGGLEQALQRSKTVYQSLKTGQSFEKLAEKNSEDPDFSQGGLLGTFKSGELSGDFEGAIRNLEPGQFSEPVKTASGVHILRLVSVKKIAHPVCERDKEKLRSALNEAAFQKQYLVYLEIKRKEANIHINKPPKI